ncbi:MAG: hypothetical protein ABH865_07445 [Candidatus Omnitrophota bacterium]
MEIENIWGKILALSKDQIVPALLEDAKKFGVENTHDARASIEDGAVLMLIWAADYAARKRGQKSIADELINKLAIHGLYMERLSKQLSAIPPPYPPNLAKVLYKELSHTLERTLLVRNQIGFAFFQNAVGEVGFLQKLKYSSRGKKYKEVIQSSIRILEEAFS